MCGEVYLSRLTQLLDRDEGGSEPASDGAALGAHERSADPRQPSASGSVA